MIGRYRARSSHPSHFLCGLVLPGESEKNVLVPRFFLLFSLQSCAVRRDALEDRLQGHCHHARANACDSEIPPLASSLHAGDHLRRHGAPRFGDAGAALVRLTVGGRANSDFEALGKRGGWRDQTESSNGYVPLHTVLARFLRAWRHRRLSLPMGILFFHPSRRRAVFPSPRLFSSPIICDRRQ